VDNCVIEVFEYKEPPVFTVQIHHERMKDPNKGYAAPGCMPLFKYFAELCAG